MTPLSVESSSSGTDIPEATTTTTTPGTVEVAEPASTSGEVEAATAAAAIVAATSSTGATPSCMNEIAATTTNETTEANLDNYQFDTRQPPTIESLRLPGRNDTYIDCKNTLQSHSLVDFAAAVDASTLLLSRGPRDDVASNNVSRQSPSNEVDFDFYKHVHGVQNTFADIEPNSTPFDISHVYVDNVVQERRDVSDIHTPSVLESEPQPMVSALALYEPNGQPVVPLPIQEAHGVPTTISRSGIDPTGGNEEATTDVRSNEQQSQKFATQWKRILYRFRKRND